MKTCLRPRARAFTLLEVLVVLLIISLTITLVQVNVGRGENAVLNDEVLRLETVLNSAQDEVSAGARALALELHEQGYRFYVRQGDSWQLEQESPFAPHVWAEGVSWGRIQVDGIEVQTLPRRLVWQAGAILPQLDIELINAGRRERLLLDALGRVRHAASEAR